MEIQALEHPPVVTRATGRRDRLRVGGQLGYRCRMAPLIIAHRGDSAHFPENTLAAFRSALNLQADLVEFDVQCTKDGQVVVIHDASVDRTTNGRGRVRDMTVAEVQALSAGYPLRFGNAFAAERIPTLGEALETLKGRGRPMIEIKSDSSRNESTMLKRVKP